MPTLIELREAPWAEDGYYRRDRLVVRVLGNSADSVNIRPDGTVVYHRARASQQTTEG